MPDTILDKYLTLTGSTTRFLEKLANAPISAKVISQSVEEADAVILRVSTLHAGDSAPLLAAESSLSLENLTALEKDALLNSDRPIGDILLSGEGQSFRRENVKISSADNHRLRSHIAGAAGAVMLKSFDLWFGDRFIGRLEEVASLASLSGALKTQSAS